MKFSIRQISKNNRLIYWIYFRLIKNRKPPKTKFLILGRYRVGSNYLTHLLNSHPDIDIHGELFNVSSIASDIFRILHPKLFLRRFYFAVNHGYSAKGFKLMYNQLSFKNFEEGEWLPYISQRIKNDIEKINQTMRLSPKETQNRCNEALEFLIGQKGFKVIHLKRRNILDTLVSTKRAFSEDTWMQKTYSQSSIELSPLECETFFSKVVTEQDYYANLFSQCETYNLYYEDLLNNFEGSIFKLQGFLGLAKKKSLNSTIKKQCKGNRKNNIKNYDLLKKHFAKSKWAIFFEES